MKKRFAILVVILLVSFYFLPDLLAARIAVDSWAISLVKN